MIRRAVLTVLPVVLAVAAVASEPSRAPGASDFAAGRRAAAAGDLDVALDLLERAAAAAPDELRYGAEYRQTAIRREAYDRAIDFFAALAERHPGSASVQLNWGYAYVDKIPAAGAITQVILADRALDRFTRAIELDPSWLALYTRGNSYVYWPAIFGRTPKGIADLERAIELEPKECPAPFHAHAWIALGDARWRLDDLDTARATWRRGLERFPGNPALEERLGREGEALDQFLEAHYAIGKRVDTSLEELWEDA